MGARLVPKGHARLVEGDVPLIELSTLFLTAYRITAYRLPQHCRLPLTALAPLTAYRGLRLPLTAYRKNFLMTLILPLTDIAYRKKSLKYLITAYRNRYL